LDDVVSAVKVAAPQRPFLWRDVWRSRLKLSVGQKPCSLLAGYEVALFVTDRAKWRTPNANAAFLAILHAVFGALCDVMDIVLIHDGAKLDKHPTQGSRRVYFAVRRSQYERHTMALQMVDQ